MSAAVAGKSRLVRSLLIVPPLSAPASEVVVASLLQQVLPPGPPYHSVSDHGAAYSTT